MKLQYMIVIFILVVLPISVVLSVYNQGQIKTMVNQVACDTKLTDATHDAAMALHTNIMNNINQSTIYNVMRENVNAATNVFVNSLATSFGVGGYTEEQIMQHVPAIVFTMYDGYYINTPYRQYGSNPTDNPQRTLKTYVYYTKRYKNDNTDIVVNFTLDNYISIYGKIGSENITKAGYLLNPDDVTENEDGTVKYKSYKINIEDESVFLKNNLKQPVSGEPNYELQQELKYDPNNEDESKKYKEAALEYYKSSKEFTKYVNDNLSDFKDGNNNSIFVIDRNNNPEDTNSPFYREKANVIREAIESNLKTAISNFNHTQTGTAIPALSEEDWNVVLNNFSVISYLQGFNVGFKIYNSYSVCPLASNSLYINKNDIYYMDGNTGSYHNIGCREVGRI